MRALIPIIPLTLLLLSACGAQQAPGTPARLRVLAEPENARVDIDERYAGSARRFAVRPKEVRPGRHRITVTAPGHFPHDLLLELPPGETTIRISLRPIP